MTTAAYKQLPSYSREPPSAPLLPLSNGAITTQQQQRKSGLKPSKSVKVKATIKAIVSPIKTRREKKATKMEIKQREEATRVANIDDFLLCGRIYYEKQLQNQMNYDPFGDHMVMEKC